MPQQVAGRGAEVARLTALLDDTATEPRAILVEGAPGIGKSCLLRALTELAQERGYVVAECQPTRTEMELSYVGLVALLDDLGPGAIEALPTPQARVLRTILRLDDGSGPVDRLSLGLATVAAVRSVAADRPVLLAVDDSQWLDPPTQRTLAFLARRLDHTRARLAFVRTSGLGGSEDPIDWERELTRAMPEGRFERLDIGPVDPSDLSRILRRVLGWAPAWPRVVRIAELSEGNPLHAVELARAFGADRALDALDGPLPDNVPELARSRIAGLTDAVREAVGLASVPRNPHLELLGHLDPGAVDLRESLDTAARQGIVVVEQGHVRFTHPILAAAAYGSLAPVRRRELHRALAMLSDNLEERARHLARASDGPDRQVAVALEGAGELAWRRGAPDAAADLLRLACRSTPVGDGEALARRRIAYGRLLHSAGDSPAAVAELEELAQDLGPGLLRATALFHLMYVVRIAGSLERAVEHGVRAAEEAAVDPLFQAEVLELLSRISDNDVPFKLDAARRALEAVERAPRPDPELVFQVRAALVEAEFYAGLGVHLERLDGLSTDVTPRFPPVRTAAHGDDLVGRLLTYDGRIDEGLDVLRGMYERALVENRSVLPAVLGWMAEGQQMAGRFTDALASTQEALDRTDEIGGGGLPWELGFHAVAQVRLGRVDEAEATARRVVDADSSEVASGLDALPARLALGLVAWSRGDLDAAIEQLDRLDRTKRAAGIREPRLCAHAGDLLEVLVLAGRLSEAADVLDRLEDEAARSASARSSAVAARGRALLLAAYGQVDEAVTYAERSLRLADGVPMPFERARTLLVLGQLRRRRREKRPARAALVDACAAFDAMETPEWAERARVELARIPDHASDGGLTPTEERVARLAAEGLTNREIAERAFLSLKTVEVNLTRVYRKLGVRRATLASALAEVQGSDRLSS
jgi:DNA-binding CsgD family transcriptional regulator